MRRRRSDSFGGFWVRFLCRDSGALAAILEPIEEENRPADHRAPKEEADQGQILAWEPTRKRDNHFLFSSMYIPKIQNATDPHTFPTNQGTVSLPETAWSRRENTSQRMPHSR